MRELASPPMADSRLTRVATSALGGLLGGLGGATLVIGFTEVLKAMLAVVSGQDTWVLIVVPLLGLALSVLVLYGFGLSGAAQDSRTAGGAVATALPVGATRGEPFRPASPARISPSTW